MTGNLYLLTPFTCFPHGHPLPLMTANLFFLSMSSGTVMGFICLCLYSMYQWNQIVFAFFQFISLSIKPSGSIFIVANDKI